MVQTALAVMASVEALCPKTDRRSTFQSRNSSTSGTTQYPQLFMETPLVFE